MAEAGEFMRDSAPLMEKYLLYLLSRKCISAPFQVLQVFCENPEKVATLEKLSWC